MNINSTGLSLKCFLNALGRFIEKIQWLKLRYEALKGVEIYPILRVYISQPYHRIIGSNNEEFNF